MPIERSALKLFFSYRRDDAAGWAGRLFDSLSESFDSGNIFIDVDSIPAGEVFGEAIRRSILDADVILAIIGKKWAGIDEKGQRRIDNPNDFVRLELATALEHNKRLIPVLVDGASPPRREQLPENIAALADHNVIELTHVRWKYDTGRLIESILNTDGISRLIASIRTATRYQAMEAVRLITETMANADAGTRQKGFELLKPLFCLPGANANGYSASQDREVRQAIWRCMRSIAVKPLEHCFANRELTGIDLYGIDFRNVTLTGVALDKSFLVESDFSDANLEGASLRDCRTRNANFTGARLNGADMTDADWFHATGLTAEQLSVVKPKTLRPCPGTVEAMRESLSGDYAYPFESWSRKVQQELRMTWERYSQSAEFQPWRNS